MTPEMVVLLVVGAASLGGYLKDVLDRREAREGCLCPTCLGPTNDGGFHEYDR